MNKIDRWFNRNDLNATHRKMKEWNIQLPEYETFFKKMFHGELTTEEQVSLTRRLKLEEVKELLVEHF